MVYLRKIYIPILLVLLILLSSVPFVLGQEESESLENNIAIKEVTLRQDQKTLTVKGNKVTENVDPEKTLEIIVTIRNHMGTDISIFVDLDHGNDGGLWRTIYNETLQSDKPEDNIGVFLEIDNTSVSRMRIRISLAPETDEDIIDPSKNDNQVILDLSGFIGDEEDDEFEWYLALIAIIPLVFVFFMILVFRISSKIVAPCALGITIILALVFFRQELEVGAAFEKIVATILYSALWGGLDYIYAIFGAFFFLKMLEKVGAMEQLKEDFKSISTDKQHQILLIGFCFALIMATVAPAGSNFVIAAIMLVSLGFNRVGVGVLCLFGNSISSVFGLLGVSIIALKEVTGLALMDLSGWIGIYMIILCIPAPLIMSLVYTKQGPLADFKDPDLREDIVLLMGMGAVYGTIQALVAYFTGPELPTIIAGGATLLFVILYEKLVSVKKLNEKEKGILGWGDEKKKSGKDSGSIKPKNTLLARPYFWSMGFMVLILLVTRLLMPLKGLLTADFMTLSVPFDTVSEGKVMMFSPLYSPGTILLIVAITVPLFVKIAASFSPESDLDGSFIRNLESDEISPIDDDEDKQNKKEKKKDASQKDKRSDGRKHPGKKRALEKSKGSKRAGEKDHGVEGERKKVKKRDMEAEVKPKKKKRKRPAADESDDEDSDEQDKNEEKKKKKKKKPVVDEKEDDVESITEPKRKKKKKRTRTHSLSMGMPLVNDGGDHSIDIKDDDDDEDNDEEFIIEDAGDEFVVSFDDDDDDDDFELEFEDDDDDDFELEFEDDDDDEIEFETEPEGKRVKIGRLADSIKPARMVARGLKQTGKEVLPIMLTIAAFMAIANIMRYFDMTFSIASTIVDIVGGAYKYFIPSIGMSGSALTGSTTTSNVLFGSLHMEAAGSLGLPLVRTAAAQVLGSSAGEMISPMNAVVIATAVGLKNKESILIKRLLPTFVLWLVLSTIISVVFLSI